MKSSELERKVLMAVRNLIELESGQSVEQLTKRLIAEHHALIRECEPIWAFERVASIFRTEMKHQNPMKRGRPSLGHPQQSRLPGFENIPIFFDIQGAGDQRKRVWLKNATLQDLRKRRAFLRGEFSAELPELNRLISVMQSYEKAHPGITVTEALKLRAASRRREA